MSVPWLPALFRMLAVLSSWVPPQFWLARCHNRASQINWYAWDLRIWQLWAAKRCWLVWPAEAVPEERSPAFRPWADRSPHSLRPPPLPLSRPRQCSRTAPSRRLRRRALHFLQFRLPRQDFPISLQLRRRISPRLNLPMCPPVRHYTGCWGIRRASWAPIGPRTLLPRNLNGVQIAQLAVGTRV